MKRKVYNKNEIHVRKLIIEKGITIQMIATHLGVSSQAVIQRLQRGTVKPVIKAINDIDKMITETENV